MQFLLQHNNYNNNVIAMRRPIKREPGKETRRQNSVRHLTLGNQCIVLLFFAIFRWMERRLCSFSFDFRTINVRTVHGVNSSSKIAAFSGHLNPSFFCSPEDKVLTVSCVSFLLSEFSVLTSQWDLAFEFTIIINVGTLLGMSL
jgi:hypothetical protein